MFDPRRDYTGAGISVMRLPTVYNADLGLYVINGNRWTLQPDEIRSVCRSHPRTVLAPGCVEDALNYPSLAAV
jgi:hypothetical protein